jgi:hypothetical protein
MAGRVPNKVLAPDQFNDPNRHWKNPLGSVEHIFALAQQHKVERLRQEAIAAGKPRKPRKKVPRWLRNPKTMREKLLALDIYFPELVPEIRGRS